ncbi:hypothetical protein BDY24DRAFT_400185 [Mrakia frigida]|uniref:uncharacterized protein n=1 Tax=Mrakia frigida TaxID=29902 RepID=UPI003FCC258E
MPSVLSLDLSISFSSLFVVPRTKRLSRRVAFRYVFLSRRLAFLLFSFSLFFLGCPSGLRNLSISLSIAPGASYFS